MKRVFVIILSIVILSCKKDKLNIDCKGLDVNKVKITLKGLVENKYFKDSLIYINGNQNKIPEIYGENDWKIFYDDSLIFEFRHFKTNWHNKHDYKFYLCEFNDKIGVSVTIIGSNFHETNNEVSCH